MSTKPQPVIPAAIEWENGSPVSRDYGDIYFSRASGMDETRHVFLEHNQLPHRWHSWPRPHFTIAETGFGTGLNFLCAADLWLKNSSCQRLHYISFEKHPLRKADLARALAAFPDFSELSGELVASYPPLTPGLHRLHLAGNRITLTLVLGDIQETFPRLARLQVDAWFLDGFAPAKNPAMWQEKLYAWMAQQSAPGATFATFTAAGHVRRGLQQAGFHVKKVPGFGHKRDMLCGQLEPQGALKQPASTAADKTFKACEKPWFLIPGTESPPQEATIVGAGLAGTAIAAALAQRGCRVTLVDRHSGVGQETSGNHQGALFARFSHQLSPQNRFYQDAFLYSARALFRHTTPWCQQTGMLQLAFNPKEQERQRKILASGLWPEEVCFPLSQKQIRERFHVDTGYTGLFFPASGWVSPPQLCEYLASHENIRRVQDCTIQSLRQEPETGLWHFITEGSETLPPTPLVVVCSGASSHQFSQTRWLPLKKIRGQVSHLPACEPSRQINTVICHDGYITPVYEGLHCIGATFDLDCEETAVTRTSHEQNCRTLITHLPEVANWWQAADNPENLLNTITGGRTGFRTQSPDYLPVIGPVPDDSSFRNAYQALSYGELKGQFDAPPCHRGLYVFTALGSRGLGYSLFGAEILASMIFREPLPIEQDVLEAVLPARFLVRNLKRASGKPKSGR